jgi:hypothetical protein
LRDHLDAKIFGGSFDPKLHHLIEWIDDPRQEADLDVYCIGGESKDRCSSECGQ